MGQSNRIEKYWQKVLLNSNYKEELSDQDIEILEYISDIRTNVTTEHF